MNKEKLLFFIHNLYPMDYLFFFGLFMLFIVVVGVVLWIRVNTTHALLMLVFGMMMMVPIGMVGYIALDKHIRPRTVSVLHNQKLLYSDNIYLQLSISPAYKVCMVDIKIIRKSNDYIQKLKNYMHPITTTSFIIHNQSNISKIIPRVRVKDYDLIVKTHCF